MIRNRIGLVFGLAALVLFAGCQKDSPNPVTPGGIHPGSASEPVFRVLGDRVWSDVNHNGIQNSGELGVPGVFVELYTCDGAFVARDTTDANGLYAFINEPVGDYKLLFIKPSNWAFSPADQGTNNNADSDPDTTTGWTVCTHLAQNQLDFSWDAGLYQLPPPRPTDASLGDLVWIDLNADGIQGAGELGIPGVTVQLLGPDSTVIATQITNGSGGYLFPNLAAGNYRIRFILPSGYAFSPADQGGNDGLDSDALANGYTTLISLAASAADLSWDAGIYLRTGGCCLDDGSCQVLTPDACTQVNGDYQGDNASCDPNPCVQPPGSCCAPDGTCTVTLRADCTATWTMFGVCSPNPCVQPPGSCCAPNGTCAVTLRADCTATWTMFGVCSPNPCVQPPGACCTTNGTCTVTTQAACTGTWRGMGTSCSPNPCPQPPPQSSFCTLTQGAYGNANGMFNGERRLAMMQRLITVQSPLMLGKPGRSVTIPDGSEQCIIDRLPAGGTASQLPNIGNGTLASGTCNTSTPLPLKNGRFQNVFLGQVIALSMNTRLDPNLSGIGLNGTMVTSAGQFTISPKVRTALTNQGLSQTVGGLLELANRALAYGTVGGASVSEINSAVDAINTGFDECRTLLSSY